MFYFISILIYNKKNYKQRQLQLVELISFHQIFRDEFQITIDNGKLPDKEIIIELEKNITSVAIEYYQEELVQWLGG